MGGFSGPNTLQSAAGATGNGLAAPVHGRSAVSFQVVITATATVTFEGTVDGSNWSSLLATQAGTTTSATTATASGVYVASCAGLAQVRARVSAWTSGSVTVVELASDTSGGGVGVSAQTRLDNGGGSVVASGTGTITLTSAANTQGTTLPTAIQGTANYGLLNLGSGPFDGASSGKFAGSSSGQALAINTANGFGGDLIRAQVFGVDKLRVDSGGNVYSPSGYFIGSTTGTGWSTTGGKIVLYAATEIWLHCDDTVGLAIGRRVGLATVSGVANAADVFIRRDAAQKVGISNGTNAQELRVYGTDDSAQVPGTNTEYLSLLTAAGDYVITPVKTGTGTLRGLQIGASGTSLGFYGTTAIARAVLATGTGKTVDNVITALQNLGLVSQS